MDQQLQPGQHRTDHPRRRRRFTAGRRHGKCDRGAAHRLGLSRTALQRGAFTLLCLIWGSTWLALKVGGAAVPPGLFSGTRWTAAGAILLLWQALRREPVRVRAHLWPRLFAVGLLMICLNAILMMYGLRTVGSGLASVISAALTPISLLGFAVATGQERWTTRQLGAIALGVCGILVLFGPDAIAGAGNAAELAGAALLTVGCLCYTAGSVLVRPLMRAMPAVQVGALTNLVGGLLLLLFSIPFEPGARDALAWGWGAPAWLAWAFLLFVSSL
ncbi:MAG: DMT family transporter, partial [Acetobacteraceae bacterium]|nr:DMT family transporter [Acetobacteraceae bacterium]